MREQDCPAALLALAGEDPLGVLGYRRYAFDEQPPEPLFINVLFVAAEHRGRGVGTALLREALQQAQRFESVLYVYTDAPAYYERFG